MDNTIWWWWWWLDAKLATNKSEPLNALSAYECMAHLMTVVVLIVYAWRKFSRKNVKEMAWEWYYKQRKKKNQQQLQRTKTHSICASNCQPKTNKQQQQQQQTGKRHIEKEEEEEERRKKISTKWHWHWMFDVLAHKPFIFNLSKWAIKARRLESSSFLLLLYFFLPCTNTICLLTRPNSSSWVLVFRPALKSMFNLLRICRY